PGDRFSVGPRVSPASHDGTASLRLPRSDRCGRVARRVLENVIADPLSPSQLDAAKSVVSELANNAVVHGSGRIDLRLTRLPGRLRIEVVDQGAGVPVDSRAPGEGATGYGFQIVSRLALAWGSDARTGQVWAEVDVGKAP